MARLNVQKNSAEQMRQYAGRILELLRNTYPEAKCSLDYRNPYELVVATILSAQCTDARVNLTTPALFEKYPDFESLSRAKLSDIERLIKSTGFFKNKALSLKEMATTVQKEYGGQLPRTIDEMTRLRGVGRKTANVVLGNAFGINEGVVVDTHVGRLSVRMGLTKAKDPVKVEQDLMPLIPQKDWSIFSHYLVFHGRARCMARNPDCGGCELVDLCPRVGVDFKKKASVVTHAVITAKPRKK